MNIRQCVSLDMILKAGQPHRSAVSLLASDRKLCHEKQMAVFMELLCNVERTICVEVPPPHLPLPQAQPLKYDI